MKNKTKILQASAGIFIVFVLAFASCTKEKTPAYVGNWAMLGTTELGDSVVQTKGALTLNENSFTYVMKVKTSSSSVWIDYMGQKGTLKVTGDSISIHFTQLGVSAISENTGLPTGVITYISEGSAGFSEILAAMDLPAGFKGTYSITGNELTLNLDINGDGDTNDPGETQIYIRD